MQTVKADPAFVRVRKGVYAVRALMGDAPYEAVGRPSKKQKPAKDKLEAAGQGGPKAAENIHQEEVESLTKVLLPYCKKSLSTFIRLNLWMCSHARSFLHCCFDAVPKFAS